VLDEVTWSFLRVPLRANEHAIENARLFSEERTKARHLVAAERFPRNASAIRLIRMRSPNHRPTGSRLTYDHSVIGVPGLIRERLEVVNPSRIGKGAAVAWALISLPRCGADSPTLPAMVAGQPTALLLRPTVREAVMARFRGRRSIAGF